MPEPRPDTFWAGRGVELEDLTRLREAQAWRPEGLPLSREAYVALAAQSSDLRSLQPCVREEFIQIGLLQEDGTPTDDGRTVVTVLGSGGRRLRLEAAAGGVPTSLEATLHAGVAVVWATDSPVPWAGRESLGRDALRVATHGHLQWLPVMHLPAELCAWLGVGPAWQPVPDPPVTVDRELLGVRTDEPATPLPDSASDDLRVLWAEPWFTWLLAVDTGHVAAGLHAGRHGQHRIVEDPHDASLVRLLPWNSEHLFRTLTTASLA